MKDSGRQKDRQRWERKEWAGLVEKHPRCVKASPWGLTEPKCPRKSKALRERGIHLQSAQGKRDHYLAAAMKDKLRALRKSRSKKSNAVKHTICGVLAKYSKFLGT